MAYGTYKLFVLQPGPGDFIARRRLKRQKRQRKPRANSDQFRQPDRATKAQRWQRPDLGRWRTHPLLGGLIPLNAAGRYACPPLVVAARTAVKLLYFCCPVDCQRDFSGLDFSLLSSGPAGCEMAVSAVPSASSLASETAGRRRALLCSKCAMRGRPRAHREILGSLVPGRACDRALLRLHAEGGGHAQVGHPSDSGSCNCWSDPRVQTGEGKVRAYLRVLLMHARQ